MRRLLLSILVVTWALLSASAQRATSHALVSGRAPNPVQAGISDSSAGKVGTPLTSNARLPSDAPRGYEQQNPGGPGDHRGSSDRPRMPYRSRYTRGITHRYPGWLGWVNPYGWGYPDTIDNSESHSNSDNPADGYDAQQVDQGQAGPPPYPNPFSYGYSYAPQPASTPANEEVITVVFKDGRPREQVHNYVLTANTLTDLDERYRNIPLDQIDISETVKLNHEAGIEFQVPGLPSRNSLH